jgi:hypothetical protein
MRMILIILPHIYYYLYYIDGCYYDVKDMEGLIQKRAYKVLSIILQVNPP